MTEYAHGFRGQVFFVEDNLPQPFNRADLVKEEQNSQRMHFALVFSQLKVANLVFPDRFPPVVGCSREANTKRSTIRVKDSSFVVPIHKIYTVRLPVDNRHIRFSNHIDLDDNHFNKVSTCACAECDNHRKVHFENQSNTNNLVDELNDAGIDVPYDDPTDWCVNSETGKVVFFEVDRILPRRLQRYAKKEKVNSPLLDRLLATIERLQPEN